MGRPKLSPLSDRLNSSERLINRLKALRTGQGLTQSEVARRLGVHRSYVSQLESKRVAISLRHLRALASIYDVPPQELFAMIGVQEFDWVGILHEHEAQADPLATVTSEERLKLAEYLSFIRWQGARSVGRP